MLCAGLSTFALLYCTQPLLPLFSRDFGLNAEEASLAVSLTTGPMAIMILVAGMLSDHVGRRPLMIGSLFLSAALTLLLGFLPGWHSLLAIRFLCGLLLAGVPAVAMAFISEEVEDQAVSQAMGLYVAGSAVGGMSGRLLVSIVTQYLGWRMALGATGLAALLIALLFWRLLPPSRQFLPQRHSIGSYLTGFGRLMSDKALPWLFLESFLLMGAFISVYNYVGFRLLAPPYSLSQVAVGAIFILYLAGSVSSALAGSAASRFGPRKTLWLPMILFLIGIALTTAQSLAIVILGIGVVTIGFFGGHAIASAWVGRRARQNRAQATAAYLFAYYMGSSILGSVGGYAWTHARWLGVSAFAGTLMLIGIAVAAHLARILPLPPAPDAD